MTVPAAPEDRLSITVTDDGHPARVTLTGEVDPHTAPLLDDRLTSLPAGDGLVLDLAGVTFIDSAGLRVLVNQHRRIGDAGGKLEVAAASDATRKLLELTGMWDLFAGDVS